MKNKPFNISNLSNGVMQEIRIPNNTITFRRYNPLPTNDVNHYYNEDEQIKQIINNIKSNGLSQENIIHKKVKI